MLLFFSNSCLMLMHVIVLMSLLRSILFLIFYVYFVIRLPDILNSYLSWSHEAALIDDVFVLIACYSRKERSHRSFFVSCDYAELFRLPIFRASLSSRN